MPKGNVDFVTFIASFTDGVYTYCLDSEAAVWRLLHTQELNNAFYIATDSRGRFLYCIDEAGPFGDAPDAEISAFAIRAADAKLQRLNSQSSHGRGACYLHVCGGDSTLLAANYSSGSIVALPLRSDGSIGPACAFHQHAGHSADPERQAGPHAHCIITDRTSRYAFVADLGLDKIVSYQLEGSNLEPSTQSWVRTIPGAGPRHLRFHPNGRFLYAINELNNSITTFVYDADTGFLRESETVSTLPAEFDGVSHTADIAIRPGGDFLYATNRGHDSIAAYAINSTTGTLQLIEAVNSGGEGPQNIALTPDGQHLLVANMVGNNVAVFRIDRVCGRLSPVGEPLAIASPSCFAFGGR